MRALLVIRGDAQSTLGGDTIQMVKTAAVLEQRGVTVVMCSVRELASATDCDVAHVFNIQTAEESWEAFTKLAPRRVPVVLSPIYWDMTEHWFDLALASLRRWQILATTIGRPAAYRLYVARERARQRTNSTWGLQRQMLQRAVRVLPNSRSEAAQLQQIFRLDGSLGSRVDVVPNGVDAALFEPAPQPSEWFRRTYGVENFILEVGAVSPVKNQLGLIQSLYDLPQTIVIVGQPTPLLPEYAEQCKQLGARRGNVIFIDRLPHEELPGIYALAAVHVLPSWRETPGLVSLEAAASGCRVVSTSIGSARDYFGDLATYCHPADHGSIRAAVEQAIARPHTSRLRDHVLENFNWERAGDATLRAYELAVRDPVYA